MTFYFDYDLMVGSPILRDAKGKKVRDRAEGVTKLGFELTARPADGFVHYLPASLEASARTLTQFLRPDQTTLVDLVLHRVVHQGVYRLTQDRRPADFTRDPPGPPIARP
jgi:hypothetical protein